MIYFEIIIIHDNYSLILLTKMLLYCYIIVNNLWRPNCTYCVILLYFIFLNSKLWATRTWTTTTTRTTAGPLLFHSKLNMSQNILVLINLFNVKLSVMKILKICLVLQKLLKTLLLNKISSSGIKLIFFIVCWILNYFI